MALLDINFHSMMLGKHHTFKVILPEQQDMFQTDKPVKKLRTLLLLHGLSSDDSMFSRYTNVEMYANTHNLAVVMPNADHSFYQNMKYGHSYYDHVLEVWRYAHQVLPLSWEREDNYVAGNSMGGFGAFHFAMNAPELFEKAVMMSAALDMDASFIDYDWYDFDGRAVFGDIEDISETAMDTRHTVLEAAQTHGIENLPELYFMCGTEDELIDRTDSFMKFLEDKHIPHKYDREPGEHNWSYWDKGIRKAIDWIFEGKEVDKDNQIMNWVG